MSKSFREYQPEQMLMMPPSLEDWLPEGHLARFISDVVGELDLSAIYQSYEKDGRGQAAYHPVMMVKLLFYGYCIGVVASRKIEAAIDETVAFRYLSANERPDHSSLAEFRRRHLQALAALFLEVLRLCQKAGLVKLGHVALDSTKIKANASRHRNVSYQRLSEQEKELAQQVEQILAEAERADQSDEKRWGDRRGDELPPGLSQRQERLQRIREAKRELERQVRQQAEQKKAAAEQRLRERQQKAANAGKPWRGKLARVPDPAKAKPQPEQIINMTDSESRIMLDKSKNCFMQGFNAQAAVDGEKQIIVAADVTPQQNDRAQLGPMIEQVEQNTGAPPEKVSADTDYYSPQQVQARSLEGVDLYIRPDAPPKVNESKVASRAGPKQVKPPRSGYGPDGIPRIDHLRAKLATTEGRSIYAKRREIVEPVFGQIKHCRGLRQFWMRGLEKTRAEWRLICLTHNLLQLYRSGWTPQTT